MVANDKETRRVSHADLVDTARTSCMQHIHQMLLPTDFLLFAPEWRRAKTWTNIRRRRHAGALQRG